MIVAGDVLLGGQNAQSFSRGQWAKAVALVSQEPVLFAGAHTSGFLLLLYCRFPLAQSACRRGHGIVILQEECCI